MWSKTVCLTIASFVWALPSLAGDPKPQLYPVLDGGKWGYMDKAGKVVIKPSFQEAKEFSEGMGLVKTDGKWGVRG